MAMPTSVTVEIEFTAGVWTDVTSYLDGQAGGSTKFGRSSRYGSISPGTLTVTLANDDGRFTPGRQVLADGVTAHPYYPNVVPRKRIRVASVVGGTPLYRFTGYIKGWPPSMVNGETPRVTINATTRDDQLSRVGLQHLILQEHVAQAAAAGGSSALYLMNDPVLANTWSAPAAFADELGTLQPLAGGSTIVFDAVLTPPIITGGAAPAMPVTEGLNGMTVTNGLTNFKSSSGNPTIDGANFAISRWFGVPVLNAGNSQAGSTATRFDVVAADASGNLTVDIVFNVGFAATPTSRPQVVGLVGAGSPPVQIGATLTGSVPNDGQPHHAALIGTTSGGTQTLWLYVDGASAGSTTFTAGQLVSPNLSTIQWIVDSSDDAGFANLPTTGGPTSFFWGGTYTPATLAAAMYGAGTGFAGDTTGARVGRLLTYAGVATADRNVDTGIALMGSQPILGRDVVSACQACTDTEAGGAAFYVGTDGKVQFRSRVFRKPAAPALTLGAEADLDGQTFAPAYDDTQLVNQVQGSRATASDTASTQTVNDAASQDTYGLTSSSFTSYASTDADVLYNAQDQLAQQRQPGYQLGQVAVDLATATTAGLYAAVAGVDIGDRIRITNLPVTAAPATQVDLYVEGWADTFNTDQYTVTFDTSPADNPPWMVWDDATYGRWQCDGQTLSGALTRTATSLTVVTAAGKPTFTTTAGAYPLTIMVGAEHIRLNSAPGGSTSPQTFTGVTRGVDGTAAAAQTGGASVDLAPASTWTL